MSFTTWLRSLRSAARTKVRHPRQRSAARPRIEALEDRLAPAVIAWDGGPAGIVVPPEEPAELAAAVRSLVLKRDEAVAMGCRGHDLVRRRFDRAAIAMDMEKVLLEVAR